MYIILKFTFSWLFILIWLWKVSNVITCLLHKQLLTPLNPHAPRTSWMLIWYEFTVCSNCCVFKMINSYALFETIECLFRFDIKFLNWNYFTSVTIQIIGWYVQLQFLQMIKTISRRTVNKFLVYEWFLNGQNILQVVLVKH